MTAPRQVAAPPRRPRLSGFTVVADGPAQVRLIGGEDVRFTLRADGIGDWLPALLRELDGRRSEEELLAGLDPGRAADARQLLARLWGERLLVEGTAAHAPRTDVARLELEGEGAVRELLAGGAASQDGPALRVLCQDRLDTAAALAWNAARLRGSEPWLWVTTGPGTRGMASPVFLPGAGPCLGCLLRGFERISPAPELWRALERHAREGGAFEPPPFPRPAAEVLAAVVRWKAERLGDPEVPAALHRLHVVETATLETSTHRVPRDPDCPACA